MSKTDSTGKVVRLRIEDPRDARPRPVDPNIALLTEHGLYVRQVVPGTHAVLCPWRDEHTTGALTATYFERDYNGHANPNFKCLHAHCEGRHLNDVLDKLVPG